MGYAGGLEALLEAVNTAEAGLLVVATAAGGAVRMTGVEVGPVAAEVARRHRLNPAAAALGADAIVAAALMSAHIKAEERLTLQLQVEQPRCALFAEVDAAGRVRGRVNPSHLPETDGRVTGILAAIKADARKEMYRGLTAIEDASIQDGLMEHLRQSVQIDGALKMHTDLAKGSARGVLVERLPGHDHGPDDLAQSIAIIEVLRDRSALEVLEAVAQGHLMGEPITVLERRAMVWHCTCSRQKVSSTLASLGAQELRSMAHEDHGATVTCHFCQTTYSLSEDELRVLASQSEADPAD